MAVQSLIFIIIDIPAVSIARVDSEVLEDGVGSTILTCNSHANPPATVSWHKVGDKESMQDTAIIKMNPIKREQAGVYICQAENSVGKSEPEETEVEVLYGPVSVTTEPEDSIEVMVGNKTILRCAGDSNPPAKYQWVQVIGGAESVRSYTSDLVVDNVVYGDQGEYQCMAINKVGGERREMRSKRVRVEVTGAPQVVKQVGEVVGIHGADVRIEAEFCSDPAPVQSTWAWGDIVLHTGSQEEGRYEAEMVPHPHMEDCYISRLTLRRVGMEDTKEYILSVENKHGKDMVPVVLNIKGENDVFVCCLMES